LLPQVAEKIEALADDDYLAMSLIRIAGLQLIDWAIPCCPNPRTE
jgi:hypothetical protein